MYEEGKRVTGWTGAEHECGHNPNEADAEAELGDAELPMAGAGVVDGELGEEACCEARKAGVKEVQESDSGRLVLEGELIEKKFADGDGGVD
ncbi:hypothetical protein NL676_005467 [Syzygium grande]|nr:hypothetical protein NL676_005467 [Syzygium grande]